MPSFQLTNSVGKNIWSKATVIVHLFLQPFVYHVIFPYFLGSSDTVNFSCQTMNKTVNQMGHPLSSRPGVLTMSINNRKGYLIRARCILSTTELLQKLTWVGAKINMSFMWSISLIQNSSIRKFMSFPLHFFLWGKKDDIVGSFVKRAN